MVKLTNEAREMFEKQLAVVATASREGTPNVGPKGSVRVVDDETLVYAESTGGKTFSNIRENPKVSVMIIDREKADGYQVKGKAELLASGALFEEVARRQEQRNKPVPGYAVKIKVEEVYTVGTGMKGKRLA